MTGQTTLKAVCQFESDSKDIYPGNTAERACGNGYIHIACSPNIPHLIGFMMDLDMYVYMGLS